MDAPSSLATGASAAPTRPETPPRLRRDHFALLYAGMLVAAAGNTALQSVMPAIGRQMAMNDVWVAIAYTWSAVLWVISAPYWARQSDRRGRKPLTLLGIGGFVVSMTLCGAALAFGLAGILSGVATFALFAVVRGIYGAVGSATPSAVQAYVASRTSRAERTGALSTLASSFGLGTIIGPALAPLLVLPFVGLSGPVFAFAMIGAAVFAAIWFLLPSDATATGEAGRGAAMSYPSLGSTPTGASVIAATSEAGGNAMRLSWRDPRIFPWLFAGVVAGHAQAASLTPLGFLVIDRLGLPPVEAQPLIGIVMMAGASATLVAQWGLIPRLGLGPRALILWGCALAAAGLAVDAMATDLYGITMGFALSSLGFGFIRPGFTAGASLAVGQSGQGAVAGMITAANGLAFIVAPGLGVWLYSVAEPLPYWVAAALTLGLLAWGWKRLGRV
ncbi:MAG TPA: MFS transporter [Sphingomonadaceae bacterium]|nr:MFS transporter [Sphingomonadaceae bacterium]